ncbi:hypothetical protein FGO68_gene7449 [Halteria grandinella]|uniref:Uncharacterized protein n=1 Tax=Halteria grandinella TaxID=5974 RepID=A0A8J8NKF8_HALGN|nr:hypothetical protein FGO68_gene7449 [Halteria grandinella]
MASSSSSTYPSTLLTSTLTPLVLPDPEDLHLKHLLSQTASLKSQYLQHQDTLVAYLMQQYHEQRQLLQEREDCLKGLKEQMAQMRRVLMDEERVKVALIRRIKQGQGQGSACCSPVLDESKHSTPRHHQKRGKEHFKPSAVINRFESRESLSLESVAQENASSSEVQTPSNDKTPNQSFDRSGTPNTHESAKKRKVIFLGEGGVTQVERLRDEFHKKMKMVTPEKDRLRHILECIKPKLVTEGNTLIGIKMELSKSTHSPNTTNRSSLHQVRAYEQSSVKPHFFQTSTQSSDQQVLWHQRMKQVIDYNISMKQQQQNAGIMRQRPPSGDFQLRLFSQQRQSLP